MLTWMLFSTMLGAVLATAALLVEPIARPAGVATRFLWSLIAVSTIAWSAVIAVGGARASTRGAVAAADALVREVPAAPNARATIAAREDVAPSNPAIPLPRLNIQLELLLLAFWVLGSATCVTILTFSAWRIARMRRGWKPTLVAGIPVLMSHDVGPAVIGVVHHGIVVPAWIETLDEASQRLVMLHEREHVRAGDPLLLWGTTLLVALMPWNVALWFALRRVRHAIEIDCDARVLRLGPDALGYCSLLVNVGGRTLAGVAPAAALAEPTTLLERRVEAMLTRRALGYRELVGAVVAIGLVVAACRSPHPAGLSSIGVAALAHELNARLATEGGRAALSSDDRYLLGEALGFITEPPESPESPVSSTPPDFLAAVDSIDTRYRAEKIDAAISEYYPSLGTNADTTPVLIGVVFDTHEQVRRHAMQRGGQQLGDAAALLRQMRLDTVSARTSSLGVARRFGGRVNIVFATERAGPIRGVSRFRAPLPAITRLADTRDMTQLVRRPGVGQSSTTIGSGRGVPSPANALYAPARSQAPAQDTITPLADSVIRPAVAKHFPSALTGGAGPRPYLWFAADRDDKVLRAASGREGLVTKRGVPNLVTWGGAARMIKGLPAAAQPGDVLHYKLLPVGRDTINVVWVRLWRGLPASP